MVFREAEILKSLNHKNIVKIQNCFTLSNMQVHIYYKLGHIHHGIFGGW